VPKHEGNTKRSCQLLAWPSSFFIHRQREQQQPCHQTTERLLLLLDATTSLCVLVCVCVFAAAQGYKTLGEQFGFSRNVAE